MILPLLILLCTNTWAADKKEITIKLTVPDAAWTITIDQVHKIGKELWIISIVSRDPNMMGAQVISTIKDTLKLVVPDLPVKHYVIGKTWNWKNKEAYTFIKNLKGIEKELKTGNAIYKKEKKEK